MQEEHIMSNQSELKIKNPKTLFDNTIAESFIPVEQEAGWKIFIEDEWVRKVDICGTPKRTYASETSAKDAAEGEFRNFWYRQWHKDNVEFIDSCFHYVDKVDH